MSFSGSIDWYGIIRESLAGAVAGWQCAVLYPALLNLVRRRSLLAFRHRLGIIFCVDLASVAVAAVAYHAGVQLPALGLYAAGACGLAVAAGIFLLIATLEHRESLKQMAAWECGDDYEECVEEDLPPEYEI